MTEFVFSDINRSTLAAPIGPSATAITLGPGEGAKFPSPSAGQQFAITLNNASTRLNFEICYCTARVVDVLTIVRAQEGTSAQSWAIGDFVWNGPTSGQMSAMVQSVHMTDQSIDPNFGDTSVKNFSAKGNSSIGGTETVAGTKGGDAIIATEGNISAVDGHLRAGLGARGYGDNANAVILGDYVDVFNPIGTPSVTIRPDGLMRQMGMTGTLAPGASQTITLPIAFPDGPFTNPVCTPDVDAAVIATESAAGRAVCAAGNNLSLSQITVSNASPAGGASFQVSWTLDGT